MWVLYVYIVPRKLHFAALKHQRPKPACASKHSYQDICFALCGWKCKKLFCCIQTYTSEQIAATNVAAKHVHVFTDQVLPYLWLLLYHTSGYCLSVHLAIVLPYIWLLFYYTSGYCLSVHLAFVLPYIWLLFTIHLAKFYLISGYCFTIHLAIVKTHTRINALAFS